MDEDDLIDDLPEENARGDDPEAWLSPKTDPKLLRGCSYRKDRRGRWSFWASGVGWQFSLTAPRGLWRRGVKAVGAEHVRCLDDAILFALGFEEGMRDAERQQKERLI